jgi:hypothetical protein
VSLFSRFPAALASFALRNWPRNALDPRSSFLGQQCIIYTRSEASKRRIEPTAQDFQGVCKHVVGPSCPTEQKGNISKFYLLLNFKSNSQAIYYITYIPRQNVVCIAAHKNMYKLKELGITLMPEYMKVIPNYIMTI